MSPIAQSIADFIDTGKPSITLAEIKVKFAATNYQLVKMALADLFVKGHIDRRGDPDGTTHYWNKKREGPKPIGYALLSKTPAQKSKEKREREEAEAARIKAAFHKPIIDSSDEEEFSEEEEAAIKEIEAEEEPVEEVAEEQEVEEPEADADETPTRHEVTGNSVKEVEAPSAASPVYGQKAEKNYLESYSIFRPLPQFGRNHPQDGKMHRRSSTSPLAVVMYLFRDSWLSPREIQQLFKLFNVYVPGVSSVLSSYCSPSSQKRSYYLSAKDADDRYVYKWNPAVNYPFSLVTLEDIAMHNKYRGIWAEHVSSLPGGKEFLEQVKEVIPAAFTNYNDTFANAHIGNPDAVAKEPAVEYTPSVDVPVREALVETLHTMSVRDPGQIKFITDGRLPGNFMGVTFEEPVQQDVEMTIQVTPYNPQQAKPAEESVIDHLPAQLAKVGIFSDGTAVIYRSGTTVELTAVEVKALKALLTGATVSC